MWSFWVAISAPRVHSPTKKNDLGELYMTQTRPEFKRRYVGSFVGARSKTTTWGVGPPKRKFMKLAYLCSTKNGPSEHTGLVVLIRGFHRTPDVGSYQKRPKKRVSAERNNAPAGLVSFLPSSLGITRVADLRTTTSAPFPVRYMTQILKPYLGHTRTHVRTRTDGRPTTNDATCGPPAWLTGTLQDRGIRNTAERTLSGGS